LKGKTNEIVVIGAHIDSINGNPANRSPGADDDASGISTMLEGFRIIAESDYVPEKTIEFMAYAAEEVGLLGSQDIARKYKADAVAVYAVVQFDMTGYVYRNQTKIGVNFDQFVSTPLAEFTTKLVDTYSHLGWARTACSHACSDHASWTRSGYRSIYPPARNVQAGLNPSIHSANDVMSNLDFKRMTEFVKLGIAFAIELSA
jgi:leucyl aminopeptidase